MLLQEQDRAGIYIGFVAGVLADNQASAEKLVTAMFPLGIGNDPKLIQTVGPGVIWVAALLGLSLLLYYR